MTPRPSSTIERTHEVVAETASLVQQVQLNLAVLNAALDELEAELAHFRRVADGA